MSTATLPGASILVNFADRNEPVKTTFLGWHDDKYGVVIAVRSPTKESGVVLVHPSRVVHADGSPLTAPEWVGEL